MISGLWPTTTRESMQEKTLELGAELPESSLYIVARDSTPTYGEAFGAQHISSVQIYTEIYIESDGERERGSSTHFFCADLYRYLYRWRERERRSTPRLTILTRTAPSIRGGLVIKRYALLCSSTAMSQCYYSHGIQTRFAPDMQINTMDTELKHD